MRPMPFAVSCPNCTAKLRSANPMKVGNKIACPKCQFDFRIEPGETVALIGPTWSRLGESGNTPRRDTRS